jgi:hypothetical protein
MDEVGHERWQAIVLALQPMVLDRRVLALEIAGFVESFTERSEVSADRPLTKPTIGIVGSCARAASGHDAAVPPIRVMNSRRLIRSAHLQ